jgi:rhodanese-related sulfurtransferase
MASHDAARRAAKAGFKNVFVMPDGIDGWLKAGKKVDSGAGKA